MNTPVVLLESYHRSGRSFLFAECIEKISATTHKDIYPALRRVEAAVRNGLHAAGFISYEAAPGLDADLQVNSGSIFPLAWLGIFKERREIVAGEFFRDGEFQFSSWRPSLDELAYGQAVENIRQHIAEGDTYQVNFTFRLRADFRGDDLALYHRLCRNQAAGYCAYLNLGRLRVLSASPELFFHWHNGMLTTRPMKGTRRRGRTTAEDRLYAEQLTTSAKELAENVMIVDLLRNDMGRISEFGSVQAPKLFDVERYPTVLQMTSTITSRPLPSVGFVEILQSLFPSGSVTGAPKIRTMQIIADLEKSPRQVYTGCIGFVSPGPEAMFNVAIRTLLIDTHTGTAELSVGSGITYDSLPLAEYEECLLKAQFLTQSQPDFKLLESILYERHAGYFLLDRHLARLADSANYFGFRCNEREVIVALQRLISGMMEGCYKVRLLLDRDGQCRLEYQKLSNQFQISTFKVAIAREPVISDDLFLFHKTTHRPIYESRLASRPDCDDVLLINERSELTESTLANLVIRLDGNDYTPPVSCGLLAGTFRAELLAEGKLVERVLYLEDLRKAEAIFLINSVRRWIPATIVE
jgi:para-aminobenzoate synthetase/4-amino-4-deoxychorismate lyase